MSAKRLPSFADSIRKRGRVPSESYGRMLGSWQEWSRKNAVRRIDPITSA